MKKTISVTALVLLVTCLVLPTFALAEGALLNDGGFFDWASIGTFSGAVAATVFVVQLLKLPLDKVWKIPTRLVAYLVALAILVAAKVFGGGITWEGLALCLINAVLVSLSAMAAYEVAIGGVEKHKQDVGTGADKPPDAQNGAH